MKAEWGLDYDFREDKCFKRPSCPKCNMEHGCVPIFRTDDKYTCINCGEEFELDPDMKEWIDVRSETKTEYTDCMPDKEVDIDGKKIKLGCGGKGTVESHYMRNEITLKWQLMGSVCKQCGQRIIV